MFVVIPIDGRRPASYAKELYYQGDQTSSIERLRLISVATLTNCWPRPIEPRTANQHLVACSVFSVPFFNLESHSAHLIRDSIHLSASNHLSLTPSELSHDQRDCRKPKGDLMSKLAKKVALVTGGSRGIGAAIAKRLAADGAIVAITYSKDSNAASAIVKAIEQAGGKAVAFQADAADAAAVRAAVEKTVATLGGIDVLVNNAGTAIPKKFEDATLEELDRVFNINVRGTMIATQAALKHMNNGGRVIMIGSCVGERMMTPGLVPYSATKGAIKMFSQGLSREVGSRGITVNNIQPGPIDTDLNPAAGDWAVPQKAATALDRYGKVEEVAALVAFVAGPEASYITGANLTVDGGTNA
jgi:3-oxoacyl-[acyl-carrier protein] reductase